MSYLVLARKWRPRRFEEMVGQEHVLRALINALDSGRVHHAFLFTGTRGVGKTTIARILAKSLNCDVGVSSRPCGTCSACTEIDEGRFVDLIEVDAASRTKVDDTRELLDNVQYAPTRGRYKVYLIDEVHMLSNHSFNALLKTLEEPPPHVKFLLATTDPQKLPVTVLSRCLQFNLKRLPVGLIADRLTHIVEQEGIAHDATALRLLARAADGSMRDGLSLLDQMLAFGGGEARETDARSMLGTVDRDFVTGIVDALADHDGARLIGCVGRMDEMGADYEAALAELASLLQRIALQQAVPDLPADELWDAERVGEFAARAGAEDLQLWYQMAILGRRDLHLAPDPKGGFEMVLLRMLAFTPVSGTAGEPGRPAAAARPAPAPAPAATRTESPRPSPVDTSPPARASAAAGPGVDFSDWPSVVPRLGLQGAARQLASHLTFSSMEGDRLRLLIDPRGEALWTRQQEERLSQALAGLAQRPLRLTIDKAEAGQDLEDTLVKREQRELQARLGQAREALESDPTVRALRERFGAVLHPESIKPGDEHSS